jgi:hypothetical protein
MGTLFAGLVPGVSNVVVALDDDDRVVFCRYCAMIGGTTFRTTLVEAIVTHLVQHAVRFDPVPDETIPAIRAAFPGGQVPQEGGDHGPFSLCRAGCPVCSIAAAESEYLWRQQMAAMGVELVDVDAMSPEERDRYDAQESAAALRAEMDDAADPDPDPDYGRDLDED